MRKSPDETFDASLAFLILCWFCLTVGCSSAASIPGKSQNNMHPKRSSESTMAQTAEAAQASFTEELRLLLSVEDPHWIESRPAKVSLKLTNISDRTLELKGYTYFKLIKQQTADKIEKDRETFWCPVDLSSKDSNHVAGRSSIILGKDQTIEAQFDLQELKWERAISSDRPDRNLFAAVPPSDYNLLFEITTRTGTIKSPNTETPLTRQIKSNEVKVSIQK